MDISNKSIEVVGMSSSFVNQTTNVTVEVFSEVNSKVKELLNTFKLDLEGAYQTVDDTELLLEIGRILEGL